MKGHPNLRRLEEETDWSHESPPQPQIDLQTHESGVPVDISYRGNPERHTLELSLKRMYASAKGKTLLKVMEFHK